MARNQNTLQSIDKTALFLVIILAIFGWLNIYGASYNPDSTSIFSFSNNAGKQFVWMLGAIVIASVILIIDHKAYEYFAYLLYAIMIIALILTPILAHNVKGSKSFLDIGPLRIQPAEFSKFIVALALAKYMGRQEYEIKSYKDLIVPFILLAVPMLIIMVPQKETGSALVLASLLIMFYREGMSGYLLLAGFVIIIFSITLIRIGIITPPLGTGNFGVIICMIILLVLEILFLIFSKQRLKEALILAAGAVIIYGISLLINIWIDVNFEIISVATICASIIYLIIAGYIYRIKQIWILIVFCITAIGYCYVFNHAYEKILQPHQKARIEELLGIIDDPSGVGYNSMQAKIALATGRFKGKGYLEGTQTKMKYVPEQHTDFIFCTVGEEWGFAGCVGVLLIYTWLILHLIKMAERQRNKFSRIYGYSVVSILAFHVVINIGMVIGMLPIIGIPLPFFSYGGSSLWGFTILITIFLKLDAARVNEL